MNGFIRHPRQTLNCGGWIGSVNRFLRSPGYILTLGAVTAIGNLLGLDLVTYTVFIAIGLWIALVGEDFLPLVPVVPLCYVAPSVQNNPGRYPGSVFYPMNGGIYLAVLFLLFTASVVWRLATDKELGGRKFFTGKRQLTSGMVLLAMTCLLSGICSVDYEDVVLRNLLFALVQGLAIGAMYFFLTGGVCWNQVPRDYLGFTGLTVGLVVLTQLLQNYLSGRIFVDGSINRELIATGWGMHNNVGGMLAMTMPFAFSLAAHRKHGWAYTVLATVLMLGTVLSCSRGSMLVAGAGYGLCAVLLLGNRESRRTNFRVFLIMAGALIVVIAVFFGKLLEIFKLFLSQLGNISQRDNLLYYGLQQFLKEPMFGSTFYPRGEYVPWDWSNLESFSSIFPPRWHNTLVQIAASCGVMGLTAYGIHRYQTVRLFLRHRSLGNTFIAVSIATLLLTSLLDCHFFNIGPVLLYSISLAFMEKTESQSPKA